MVVSAQVNPVRPTETLDTAMFLSKLNFKNVIWIQVNIALMQIILSVRQKLLFAMETKQKLKKSAPYNYSRSGAD